VSLEEGALSPADQLREALITDDPTVFPDWLEDLGDTFRLQTFRFDRGLRRSRDFSDLDFEAPSSDLVSSLESAQTRFENRPLAAILALTDGNATDLDQLVDLELSENSTDESTEGEKATVPIFPIIVGEENPEATDLGIARILAETTEFEDARVTLTVEANARGMIEGPAVLTVTNEKGEELARKPLTFPKETGSHSLSTRVRLAAIPPGLSTLSVSISPEEGTEISELTEKNNLQRIVVNTGSGPYRILYVSGRPNWEYKFLRRSLAEDAEIELVGLIRIAKREPKFEWRGRTGESSNPLFRGFGSDIPEETQRYDEPVLIRLNTASPEELRDGFPKAEEDLFPHYRAIVLDDVEAEFFTQEQLELIDRFVSRRGGSVIMLGGQESFQPGGWDNTTVGRLLPVYLDKVRRGPPAREATYNLTREGWLEPWMRLRAGQEEENTRLAYMPPFFAINQISAIKPGASILATVTDIEDRKLPAVVTQRYGEGKSAAVTVADFWRWGLKDPEQQEELGKTWRQLLRWGVNDVPTRIEMESEHDDSGGSPLTRLSIRVRDDTFEPQDDASVLITATQDDGTISTLTAEPSLEEPGLFTTEFSATDTTGYRLEATVLDGEGTEIGTSADARVFDAEASEFAQLGPNPEPWEKLASASGGRVLRIDELHELPDLLQSLNLPLMETKQRPLWHTPWLFLIALAFFLGEWILRRRQGIL
ncbi:MAG: hypothetical protein AAGC68_07780, partial [Verrucomicrobiota bacterium]